MVVVVELTVGRVAAVLWAHQVEYLGDHLLVGRVAVVQHTAEVGVLPDHHLGGIRITVVVVVVTVYTQGGTHSLGVGGVEGMAAVELPPLVVPAERVVRHLVEQRVQPQVGVGVQQTQVQPAVQVPEANLEYGGSYKCLDMQF